MKTVQQSFVYCGRLQVVFTVRGTLCMFWALCSVATSGDNEVRSCSTILLRTKTVAAIAIVRWRQR